MSDPVRLTLLISPQVLIDLKKAAVDEGKSFSRLTEEIFTSYLYNGLARGTASKSNGAAVPKDPETVRLTVYLPQTLITEFKKAAIELRVTYSKLAEESFRLYLHRKKPSRKAFSASRNR